MGSVQLLSLIALGCLGVVSCEFVYVRPIADGYIYSFNGRDFKIQEEYHRRYQSLDPATAEQQFIADVQALQSSQLNNRVAGQSSTDNRRTDGGFSSTNNKNQGPTNEEINYSQNPQSFKPNKQSNSGSSIHFPNPQSNAPGQVATPIASQQQRPGGSSQQQRPSSSQSFQPNSPQSSRPFVPSPNRDSDPIETQSTGFNREIPAVRERENNRNPEGAVTNFAWNLFKNSNTLPNFVLSPLSPQMLLSYLAYVAEAQTRDELVNVEGFGNPDQLNTIVGAMLSDPSGRELQIATAFFVSQEMRLNQQFLDKSVQNADVVPVDFKNPEVAGRTITRWATQKTKGALKLNKIDFAPSTKIALTSALYFKGKFIYSFPKAQPGLFNAPGRTVQAEMMNMKRKLRYGRMGNSAEWVAIPYESSDSLVIILPHKDLNIDVLINDMSAADIQSVMRELDTETSKANVNITMPKFKLESTTSLIAPLKKMGIVSLFSQQAELPYLSDYDKVQVSNAQQQASIDVNEEGTVLVAFTNVNVVALSFQIPIPDVEFHVNRPFIAMIADTKRNIPYCMAKISNPLA